MRNKKLEIKNENLEVRNENFLTSNFSLLTSHLSPLTSHFLLFILLTTYTVYFSSYTIQRHENLHSYAADLSLIDQPMWNTIHGNGFMEVTWGENQQPRWAEHFEPILIPLSALFWLWPDVQILLIIQTLALALGAIPVYWLAHDHLKEMGDLPATLTALGMVTIYLLSPHLQAANMADFHADPFVVTPLLLAFWYARQQHWPRMWLWAIIAMTTKEPLPTLTAMLGVWLIIEQIKSPHPNPLPLGEGAKLPSLWGGLRGGDFASHRHGLALIFVSTAWFLGATFLIVTPLARHYFGTDGPIYFANRYGTETMHLSTMLTDPARWHYALGLLASMGFLPLLAPDILLLGLPVFLANYFSNFAGQYSGEQHYSVPLVAALIIATVYGTRRALRLWLTLQPHLAPQKGHLLLAITLWLLTWSLGYHIRHGWTPLSLRAESYPITATSQALPALLAQIPPNAAVSASAAILPHLAHRRVAYIFPTVATADYLLVDVTDIPGMHPYDAHNQLRDMLRHDWQLITANQGLILARKSPQTKNSAELPISFYDFTHRRAMFKLDPPQANFNNKKLQLLNYTLHDDLDNGVSLQFYWQAAAPLSKKLQLWSLFYDEWGNLLNDPSQTPMIATVWYPPSKWHVGEVIVTKTLPQLLPYSFQVGMAVGLADGFRDPKVEWDYLTTCHRMGLYLQCQPQLTSPEPLDLRFSQTLQLLNIKLPDNPNSDHSFPLVLTWAAMKPMSLDYLVFIHLLDEHDQLIAQSDQTPTWLWPQPTSQWPPQQRHFDRHTLTLPANLPSGRYRLKIGFYDRATLQRLTLPDGADGYNYNVDFN